MKQKTKDILKAVFTSKKGIAAIILFIAPVIGIAISPEFAAGFSMHMAEMLTMIIDMLPTEVVEGVASEAASSVPTAE